MIDSQSRPIEWSRFLDQLDEARVHLEELVLRLDEEGYCDEAWLRVALGHIYAHLNRAWHARSHTDEVTEALWLLFSQFPADVEPVA
ncbi:MAG: hypothetical protein JW751_18595 [Polyangiaceae bacterium]|nr:hypothetical protein [Polyangiaceae bacterium]